jgi:hypothetical protein
MVGAGLNKLLALAATNEASLGRMRRVLEAWGRKELLDSRYLALAGERLDAATRALAGGTSCGSDAGTATASGHEQQPTATKRPKKVAVRISAFRNGE